MEMCKKLTAVNKYRLELTNVLICKQPLAAQGWFLSFPGICLKAALGLEKRSKLDFELKILREQ